MFLTSDSYRFHKGWYEKIQEMKKDGWINKNSKYPY